MFLTKKAKARIRRLAILEVEKVVLDYMKKDKRKNGLDNFLLLNDLRKEINALDPNSFEGMVKSGEIKLNPAPDWFLEPNKKENVER